MKKFLSLQKKKTRKVIGVLSGTSMDGVDVVLTEIRGSGLSTLIRVIDFKEYAINPELKKFILKCCSKSGSNVEDICRLNFILAHLFAKFINKIISQNKLKQSDIDLIGTHGQTIYHFPFDKKILGYNSKSTLQSGDPAVIAHLTGITTIGDFRVGDIAAGGDGAPLVPYLDYILFQHKTKSRAFVNIGGMSNVTCLEKSCRQNEVAAFDTGPGNVLIDLLMKKFFNKSFDKDGKTAAKGKVNLKLFNLICLKDKFYKKKPPKSTGREYYNEDFLNGILKNFRHEDYRNIITTFTKFTAYTIFHNINNFKSGFKLNELFVSGGGAKNIVLMNYLREYFKGTKVTELKSNGINADNKEAVLFAVLANELVSGNKTNMPSVTGSNKNVYLGKICIA